MSKKIILFPNLSKKYFLPFGIALFQIILINVNKYYPDNNKNTCLELFSSSLGFMLIRILPCLFKISHSNQERRHKKKRTCIYYIILIIIQLFTIFMMALSESLNKNKNTDTGVYFPIINQEFLKMGLEMIFLILLSKYILKYNYFKHHIIVGVMEIFNNYLKKYIR